jgi:hypothetical protein
LPFLVPLRPAYEEIYLMHAKELVLNVRRDKDLSYKELCRRLEAYDVRISEQALINKLNRGLYSFGFALLMLDVMGTPSIKVPHLLGTRPQRRT